MIVMGWRFVGVRHVRTHPFTERKRHGLLEMAIDATDPDGREHLGVISVKAFNRRKNPVIVVPLEEGTIPPGILERMARSVEAERQIHLLIKEHLGFTPPR